MKLTKAMSAALEKFTSEPMKRSSEALSSVSLHSVRALLARGLIVEVTPAWLPNENGIPVWREPTYRKA